VPVVTSVDISALRSPGSPDAAAACARSIDTACRETGFLSVTGHGIPAELIDAMLRVTTDFFDQPLPYKTGFRVEDRAANRGYAGSQSEALSYSIGKPSPPDLFEAFNVGWELSAQQRKDLSPSSAHLFAPNPWPELEGFRATWLAYWDAMHELGRVLLRGCALALDLPSDYFDRFVAKSASVMRAINYQREEGAPEPLPDQMRMGAHTDYGSLTVLLADPVPGLQVLDRGQWCDVIPEPGAFIVNIGDLLAEWTNDRWHSTLHRVVPPPSAERGAVRRRSIAWFQQPDPDAVIEVLPSLVSADRPAKYPPVTSGEHLMAKLMGPRTAQISRVDEVFTGAAR
jgi:isopenicillin N synthase-like dioxygenase